ncbi:MAG: dTMP kinase [Bacteroidales bacterium]|jgi:dTMP kinase|nr:dTMP kinase [Bacteroidales bacterium]MCU0408132.1 dTMP kinase [Bacteroidales bacterium]
MRLIVIEGVDGAGKSTQIGLLSEYLEGKGHKCEFLHFPRTDAPYFGELIARFLRGEFGSLGEVDPYLVAMLYAGDRKDAASIIGGWLREGKTVLLDRYAYSNIAYQCAKLESETGQNELRRWIMSLEFTHFAIPEPDLNIFLDVPFLFTERKLTSDRSGDDRTYLNGSRDIHEDSLNFQKKVRDVYLKVAQGDRRLAVVDCSDSEGQMLPPGRIAGKITDLLKERNII